MNAKTASKTPKTRVAISMQRGSNATQRRLTDAAKEGKLCFLITGPFPPFGRWPEISLVVSTTTARGTSDSTCA